MVALPVYAITDCWLLGCITQFVNQFGNLYAVKLIGARTFCTVIGLPDIQRTASWLSQNATDKLNKQCSSRLCRIL